jgi:hypothetical protein
LETIPICARGAYPIHEDFYKAKLIGPSVNRTTQNFRLTGKDEAAAVITKERNCEKFTELMPGLSPKEHIDMNLLEMQKAREDRRDLQQHDWHRDDIRMRNWHFFYILMAAIISPFLAVVLLPRIFAAPIPHVEVKVPPAQVVVVAPQPAPNTSAPVAKPVPKPALIPASKPAPQPP